MQKHLTVAEHMHGAPITQGTVVALSTTSMPLIKSTLPTHVNTTKYMQNDLERLEKQAIDYWRNREHALERKQKIYTEIDEIEREVNIASDPEMVIKLVARSEALFDQIWDIGTVGDGYGDRPAELRLEDKLSFLKNPSDIKTVRNNLTQLKRNLPKYVARKKCITKSDEQTLRYIADIKTARSTLWNWNDMCKLYNYLVPIARIDRQTCVELIEEHVMLDRLSAI